MDHGASGYGIYWALVEILHEENSHSIVDTELFERNFAKQMSTDRKDVRRIIQACTQYELLHFEDGILTCDRVDRNVQIRAEISESRSKAGKASAMKRASNKNILTSVEQPLTPVQQNPTNLNKGKERKGKERKESGVFTPPTLSEVEAFFLEKGYSGAERAWSYYQVSDWKDSSGKQVKNWKQKMIAVWMKPENKTQGQIQYKY